MSRDHKTKKPKPGTIKPEVIKPTIIPKAESKPVITEDQTVELIKQQQEMAYQHIDVLCAGLVASGLLESIISLTLMEVGINSMFQAWIEEDFEEGEEDMRGLTIEKMKDLIKRKLLDIVEGLGDAAAKEKAELELMGDDSDDEPPTRH